MQRYANDRTLNFKAKLGKILAFGGVGIVIFIFILSFQEGILTNILLVVAVIGMLVFQYGYFLNNRWGKHPRIDEVFDQALKGFDSRYSIFHYELGTNHVLIGPGGIFALVPVFIDGEITFDGKRWWRTRIRRGKEQKRALKNLTAEAENELRSLNKTMQKKLLNHDIPEIKPILVFLHPETTTNADNAPILAVHLKKLKAAIRKFDKGQTLDQAEVLQLADSLGF